MSESAIQFLRLFGGPSVQVCIQIFRNKGDKGTPAHRHITIDDASAWEKLKTQNEKGMGVYYVLNETDGKGREAKNITRVRAFAVDLDGSPYEPTLEKEHMRPHFVVQTSPDRYQALWLCNACPIDKFRPIQEALARRFSGDPAISDLGRVLRLPGFTNQKREPPFPVKVIQHNPGPMYSWVGIIQGFGLSLDETRDKRNGSEYVDESKPIPSGGRHKFLAYQAYRLRGLGLTDEALYQAVNAQNRTRCVPPIQDEREIRQIISSAIKNVTVDDYRGQRAPQTQQRRALEAPRIIQVKDLMAEEFPPTHWIIEDLLPAGLTILAGRPKVGKSWLGLSLCLAVSAGTPALGAFQTNKGASVNLALEDHRQRFQYRTAKILGGKDPNLVPSGFQFCNRWPRQNDGGMDFLENWIQKENGNARLIVVDTLQKIRRASTARSSEGIYERDYSDVGALQELAQDNNIAIVVIHHQNKGDSQDPLDKVSGSAGVTGAADTVWTLNREDRGEMRCWIEINGRDISDRKYDLAWNEDRGSWTFCGIKGQDLAGNKEKVLEIMRDRVPRGPSQIAELLGRKDRSNISRYIKALVAEEILQPAAGQRGKYVYSPQGTGIGVSVITSPDSLVIPGIGAL